MPIYEFRNVHTGEFVEIIRDLKDRDMPPTLKELVEAGVKESDQRAGPWERVLSGGQSVRRSNAWGHGKGYYNSQSPSGRVYDKKS